MEQFITTLPTTLLGWITLFITVSGSIIFLMSKVRKTDLELLRGANTDLRNSLDDLRKEVDQLKTQVKGLENRNKTLEDLAITALKQYFFENPVVAKQMKEVLIPK